MKKILVTGGSGFFGGVLKRRLLAEGYACVNIDLVADQDSHANLTSVKGDIRDIDLLARLYAEHGFAAVFHCAAQLAHDAIDDTLLWTSNVDGTRNIAEANKNFGVKKLVFISTNCLWASNLGKEVDENEVPDPVELYGRSKLAGEQILKEYEAVLDVITIPLPDDHRQRTTGAAGDSVRVHSRESKGLGGGGWWQPLPVHLRAGPGDGVRADAGV